MLFVMSVIMQSSITRPNLFTYFIYSLCSTNNDNTAIYLINTILYAKLGSFAQFLRYPILSPTRGKSATGRPLERELTVEEKLQRAETRIKYLERENELLKKLDRIERSVVNKPSEKYQLMHDMILTDGNNYTIAFYVRLLALVGVATISGYRMFLRELRRNERITKNIC